MVGVRASPTHQSNYKIMQKTFKGASMPKNKLDAYGVGLMRLHEVSVASVNLSHEDIEYIGRCSISRRKVVLGKVGNFWGVRGRTMEQEHKVEAQYHHEAHFRPFFIIDGKRITELHPGISRSMGEYECCEMQKPLHLMDADEVFHAARGERPSRRHAPKINLATRIANYARMNKQ